MDDRHRPRGDCEHINRASDVQVPSIVPALIAPHTSLRRAGSSPSSSRRAGPSALHMLLGRAYSENSGVNHMEMSDEEKGTRQAERPGYFETMNCARVHRRFLRRTACAPGVYLPSVFHRFVMPDCQPGMFGRLANKCPLLSPISSRFTSRK